MVTQIALDIFSKWVDFAMGRLALGNKRLVYPTGRYAASIQYKQEGESVVAISASAPEAEILEQGHGQVDLKSRLQHGRAYPMHRPTGFTSGTKLRRRGAGPPSLKPRMWAEIRSQEASGFASIGPNSEPGSWIIPPMPAYSPALILAAQAQAFARGLRQ